MSWVKKHAFLISLIVLLYGAFFFFHQKSHRTSIQILGANNNLFLFEEPEDGRKPILEAMNNAQKEILVEMYLLSDKQIISALIQAKEKGIMVKVMLEQNPFGGGNQNQQTKKILEKSNIQVIWTNPAFALTHEKSIVIDGTEAFILNQNLTASSFGKNREFNIIDDNPEDVTQAKKIFEADWQRQAFTPLPSHLVESPDTARFVLTRLLQHATKTIDIEMEVIDDKAIMQLLEQMSKIAQVRIIIPPLSKVSSNNQYAYELQNTGVDIRTLSSPYIHAKLILCDDTQAYVGSINFTTQSMDQNRELGIIISQDDVTQKIADSFETDWGKAEPL